MIISAPTISMNAVNISTLSLPASPLRSASSRLVTKEGTRESYSLTSNVGGAACTPRRSGCVVCLFERVFVMPDLFAARSQMGVSLVFHIIFAVVGIGLPALMVIAEHRWRRTGDAMYLELAKRWSKGAAILFAVGAVSGTVLSFELGLLWPEFMKRAGPIIGMPFSLEGFAFFTEAIFLGIYLYGWDRISAR